MDEKVKQAIRHHHKILAGAIKKVYEKQSDKPTGGQKGH